MYEKPNIFCTVFFYRVLYKIKIYNKPIMSIEGKKIFLIGKDGIQKDKTQNIDSILFNEKNGLYEIRFIGSEGVYTYKKNNVKIITNCLQSKNSFSVFTYLKEIAQCCGLENEEGQNLLKKYFEKINFIEDKTVLSSYLNPGSVRLKKYKPDNLIFPFGCNNSQYTAVQNALENSLSIIQGPPGTGKTQTILNIIANLLIKNKTVLVVSNNNAATANILDKLSAEQNGLDFICANLGKKENADSFFKSQNGKYPEKLHCWDFKDEQIPSADLIYNECIKLRKLYDFQERISEIKSELSQIKTEKEYFALHNSTLNIYKNLKIRKLSSNTIITLWQRIQKYLSGEIPFFILFKLELFLKYGIGNLKFWNTDVTAVIVLLKEIYYVQKRSELTEELEIKEKFCDEFSPKDVYTDSLKYLQNYIYKKYCKDNRKIFSAADFQNNFKQFQYEYPIVLSTTFSARNCLPYYNNTVLYDYLIIDEASQVDIVTGAIALSCAKNAVIVGDKMQLPNVVNDFIKKQTDTIFNSYSLNEGYRFDHSFLESVERIIPDVPQTLLREHYRCHPKIINFCNQKFYNNQLLIMTEDKGEQDVLKAIKTVPGNHCTDRYNQRQIDVIKNEILPELQHINRDDIGIIAPYRNQTEHINTDIDTIEGDTVHKFQGREKDTIIISTVDNEITDFSDDTKLLNVAISRAKKRLYIVLSGNEQSENTNIMDLIKYIEYNNFTIRQSNIVSVFDYLYKQYTEQRLELLKNIENISKYPSENIAYYVLKNICKKNEFSHLDVIFEMPLRELIKTDSLCLLTREEKAYVLNKLTHTDFLIYKKLTKQFVCAIELDGYSFHKRGTKQTERDTKKDRIFTVIGLPFTRISTKESDIENKVITFLRSLSSN